MNPSKKCKKKPFLPSRKKYMKRNQEQPTKLNVVFSSFVPKGKNKTNKQTKAITAKTATTKKETKQKYLLQRATAFSHPHLYIQAMESPQCIHSAIHRVKRGERTLGS